MLSHTQAHHIVRHLTKSAHPWGNRRQTADGLTWRHGVGSEVDSI